MLIINTLLLIKCRKIFYADACYSFFRCYYWYVLSSVLRCSYSLSFFPLCATLKMRKRERERERVCTRMRARARDTRIQATHTVAPSINRCVCCFNLPWARVTSRQRAISATRKSLRNVAQWDTAVTFSRIGKKSYIRNKRNIRIRGPPQLCACARNVTLRKI